MLRKVKVVCIAVMALFMVACSGGKIVKTYEGESLAKEQVAVLTAPENISLISVNGRKVPKYLLSSISVNYGLRPGANVVTFEYESLWAVASKGEDTPRSELVQSSKKEVMIEALAGEKYTFQFEQVEDIDAAKQLASQFVAKVVDSKQQVIATSENAGVYTPPVEKIKDVQPVKTIASKPADDSSSEKDLPTLEGLKVLWKSASAEDKKAFLKWAFE